MNITRDNYTEDKLSGDEKHAKKYFDELLQNGFLIQEAISITMREFRVDVEMVSPDFYAWLEISAEAGAEE